MRGVDEVGEVSLPQMRLLFGLWHPFRAIRRVTLARIAKHLLELT